MKFVLSANTASYSFDYHKGITNLILLLLKSQPMTVAGARRYEGPGQFLT